MNSDSTPRLTAASAWVPIESNPDLLTEYSWRLGATVGIWMDVLSLDESGLNTIPKPVIAVIFLYTPNDEYQHYLRSEDEKLQVSGQPADPDLYFMRQTIGGACGTIGLIHALANNCDSIGLADGSPLSTLINESLSLTPELRGQSLQNSSEIEDIHKDIAARGQTAAPEAGQRVGQHYTSFVNRNGHLYELNGGRPFPVNHGATNAENLLNDAAVICRNRMEILMASGEFRFSVLAFTTGI